MPRLESVNIGQARDAEWAGRMKRTAIDKRPVSGPAEVGRLNIAGDQQADPEHHGGPEKAVYSYAAEDYAWWAGELGRDLVPGAFGENITVSGLEVSGALLGERWVIGDDVELEITGPRVPCSVFRNWMGERGWVKRFAAAGRPGAYMRVVREGIIAAGDPITVIAGPAGSVSVAEALRAFYGDAELMRRLSRIPGRSRVWDAEIERVLNSATA